MSRKFLFFILPLLVCILTTTADPSRQSAEDTAARMSQKAAEALSYCKTKGMNTDYCILVDMKVHSGLKRLWVWDFAKGQPTVSSLCCHGMGMGSTGAQPVFSNAQGSYCTSLGKYRIGIRAYSQWGINVHYKLHGLDSTNSNAFKRIVVLHAHTPVPAYETYPYHLPMGYSLGCPVINNDAMRQIDALLSKASKPVLLWIYY